MEKAIAKSKKRKFKNLPLFMIALPGIVYLLINNYIPMFGIFLAFKNYSLRKGVFGSDWCGLQNFQFLFKTKDAWIMTRNTILYNVAFIIIGTIVAIAIAVMMCELGKKTRVKFFQAALLLPNLLSWVVIGFIAYAFLNADTGFINKTILAGLGLDPVSWYSYTGAWPAIIIIVNLWKNMGYQSIVYMASISGIDKSIYEAAAIDGCNRAQIIAKVILPAVRPGFTTVIAYAFITCWNEYLLSYTLLTDQKKFPISVGLKYLVGEYSTDYSALAAGCIIALIPPILLFAYVQKHLVSGMNAGAVKG